MAAKHRGHWARTRGPGRGWEEETPNWKGEVTVVPSTVCVCVWGPRRRVQREDPGGRIQSGSPRLSTRAAPGGLPGGRPQAGTAARRREQKSRAAFRDVCRKLTEWFCVC